MSVKLEVDGYLGKDPYVQEIANKKIVVLSLACRRSSHKGGSSRHADWITGTIWDPTLQAFVLGRFKRGDKIKVIGVMGKLSIYYSADGKPKPGLDMFINALGTIQKAENKDAIQ